jgi:hypothetical protein
MLFSASGATGKSALAKHIANKCNGIYWNLAQIKLGENSFHGTLAKAVGFENISSYLNDLKNGRALLVIDAFDEADMISGRASIEFLLNDLNEVTKESTNCSIILLARTETALYISEYCSKNKISLDHYEIGFFTEYYSKEFIKAKINDTGHNTTDVVSQCIDQQFNQLRALINDDEAVLSFIGYAPVLEALAKAYDKEKNTVRLLNSLKTGTASSQIIIRILADLVEREQKKVCQGLKERWGKKHPDLMIGLPFTRWKSNLYISLATFFLAK